MNVTVLLDILKYILPALIVLAASYLIIQKFLTTQTQQKQLALLQDTQDITIKLRLQAYERLVLFIERIHPRQLVPRVYESGMTVSTLQQLLVFNVNTEFEHNLSQQIYVSRQVWETVKSVKEQELNMINQIARQLPADAPAKDLHMRIVDYVMTVEGDLPTDIALQTINEEAKKVLAYGAAAS
ncbi:hypothetical protein ACTHGU_21015 [Chitinophagaceae bacterium MMS25-I14]